MEKIVQIIDILPSKREQDQLQELYLVMARILNLLNLCIILHLVSYVAVGLPRN